MLCFNSIQTEPSTKASSEVSGILATDILATYIGDDISTFFQSLLLILTEEEQIYWKDGLMVLLASWGTSTE